MDDHVDDKWGTSFVRFAIFNPMRKVGNNFWAEEISHEYGSKYITDGYSILQ